MRRPSWDRTHGRPEPIAALNRVREKDNGEKMIDLRIAVPKLRIARETIVPFLREQVVAMLHEAAEKLPPEYRFAVVDAWRPLARQQRIYDFFMNAAKEAYPDRPHASLRRTVCRWVAPPDQKAPPGHCTGAAVDLQLETPDGELVDVSAPFERFQAAPTFTNGLTPEAKHHRLLIYNTMVTNGFSNCRDEYWHYSYGDAGWAVRLGLDSCIYGAVSLPKELYAEQEKVHAENMKERTNPFLPTSS